LIFNFAETTTASTKVCNNTITANNYGLVFSAGATPTISNCIIWGNGSPGNMLAYLLENGILMFSGFHELLLIVYQH
jgi:parallel beta-helix repeat protein